MPNDLPNFTQIGACWGIGVLLTQKDDDGNQYVIAYSFQRNNDVELKYSSHEDEYLAVV